jgi:hypothetical protein
VDQIDISKKVKPGLLLQAGLLVMTRLKHYVFGMRFQIKTLNLFAQKSDP